ncbi:alpha/beta fold hydrolase [Streptomyces sp. NPDC000594]|uniref:esterase/lipase family protein n=1 Tax=Streptomyces sp. NPDC000594 TaxID=3154261 RepID=UPI0033204837
MKVLPRFHPSLCALGRTPLTRHSLNITLGSLTLGSLGLGPAGRFPLSPLDPLSPLNPWAVRGLAGLRDLRAPAALRATALELAILAGHLLLYPTGITAEAAEAAEAPPGEAAGTEGAGQAEEAAGATAPSLPAGGADRPPVVLLHGFVDNRSVFVLLRRSLARHGWRHLECLNHSPLTCDIPTAAEALGRRIEEICARTGRERVDVVGHSLGGLIARYYIQCLGGDRRVRTLVTLGTPHSGTTVAPLADAHPVVRQMRPGSAVIEELRRPAPGCRTRFVSFWSDLDRVMAPVETAQLEHPDLITENVQVTGVGHLALPVHPAVAAAIREALEAPRPGAAPGVVSVA